MSSQMAEPLDVLVPDIGDFKQIPVISVLVAPGASVAEGDPLVELESDKATMEVPSPHAGTVIAIHVKIGDRLSQGDRVVAMSVDGSAPAPAPQARTSSTAAAPPATAPPSAAPRPTSPASAAAPVATASDRASAIAYASPSVRQLARELGIDIAAVVGSGPHERILREDLLAFVKRSLKTPQPSVPPPAAPAFAADLPPWPEPDHAKFGPIDTRDPTRIQKLSAANLARNWLTIPHVTNFDKADITETERFRKLLNPKPGADGVKVTMLAFLIKASVSALKSYPRFNVSFAGGRIVEKHYYNIGFAADTADGLVVAVISDCDRKGIVEIAAEARRLAEKARAGKLTPKEMSGGCFTVSSLGGVGGTGFTPIINAPEVAILGAAPAEIMPVWNGTTFIPRLILPLSLSWDHRAVDGAMAARFLGHIASCVEDSRKLML